MFIKKYSVISLLIMQLNIVSFDIPYPPDYGGAIDIFYRIRELHEQGVKIIFHTFEYGRKQAEELKKYCEEIHYYKRKTGICSQFSTKPYIVYSRKNKSLLENLKKNDFPILFEGIHTCYYLSNPQLKNRKKIIRTHNVEHHYYYQLAKATNNLPNKIYFLLEALRLKFFEKKINNADFILPISHEDTAYFEKKYSTKKITYISGFHPYDKVISHIGKSDYILYHANLSVSENEKAAIYLTQNIFSKLPYKCVIAGRNPSKLLKKSIEKYNNISLVRDPANEKMQELLHNAHINLLITFQETGLKLKLLSTLFSGRHVLVNPQMLVGMDKLKELCHIANNDENIISTCRKLMDRPFTENDISLRKQILFPLFDNSANAERIIQLLND
ncbi:MAG: glycosyltransferase family 1 protein [Bacteroidales bacterium]|nr:glycosyltransferase family 1 protein [Bacteroidales bacterium]